MENIINKQVKISDFITPMNQQNIANLKSMLFTILLIKSGESLFLLWMLK